MLYMKSPLPVKKSLAVTITLVTCIPIWLLSRSVLVGLRAVMVLLLKFLS